MPAIRWTGRVALVLLCGVLAAFIALKMRSVPAPVNSVGAERSAPELTALEPVSVVPMREQISTNESVTFEVFAAHSSEPLSRHGVALRVFGGEHFDEPLEVEESIDNDQEWKLLLQESCEARIEVEAQGYVQTNIVETLQPGTFLSIELLSVSALRARVVDNTGNPIEGAIVQLQATKALSDLLLRFQEGVGAMQQREAQRARLRVVETDAEGYVTLRNFPSGDYRVWIKRDGFRSITFPLELQPGERNAEEDWVLHRGNSLTAVVRSSRYSTEKFEVRAKGNRADQWSTVGAVQHVSDGEFFELSGFGKIPVRLIAQRLVEPGFLEIAATEIAFNDNQQSQHVELEVGNDALHITVVDPDGARVPGVKILTFHREALHLESGLYECDDNGEFRIRGLPDGYVTFITQISVDSELGSRFSGGSVTHQISYIPGQATAVELVLKHRAKASEEEVVDERVDVTIDVDDAARTALGYKPVRWIAWPEGRPLRAISGGIREGFTTRLQPSSATRELEAIGPGFYGRTERFVADAQPQELTLGLVPNQTTIRGRVLAGGSPFYGQVLLYHSPNGQEVERALKHAHSVVDLDTKGGFSISFPARSSTFILVCYRRGHTPEKVTLRQVETRTGVIDLGVLEL